MRTCCTGCYDWQIGTLGVVGDGNVAAGDVANHFGYEERRDAAETVLHAVGVFALEGLDAADAAADGHAKTARVDILAYFQSAVGHGLGGGGQCVECIDVVVTDHVLVNAVVFGVEVLHLGGHLHGKVSGIEFGDEVNAAEPIDEVVPQCLDVVSDGGDAPDTGDINFSHIINYCFLYYLYG